MALPGAGGELRHPPRLAAARGRHRGGDGAVRRIRFREADDGGDPLRPSPRAALSAWRAASRARSAATRVERADGTVEKLGGTDQCEMEPGDVFVIETPGGGGFWEEGLARRPRSPDIPLPSSAVMVGEGRPSTSLPARGFGVSLLTLYLAA